MITIRMALTRALFRLIERLAFETKASATNIPGDYSHEEFEALRWIWKRQVVREIQREQKGAQL